EAVGGLAIGQGHDASVVDQQIEGFMVRPEALGEALDRREAREIEGTKLEQVTLDPFTYELVDGGLGPGLGPASHDDPGALAGERAGGLEPKPAVGPGDDRELVGEVGDVGRGPLGHGASIPRASRPADCCYAQFSVAEHRTSAQEINRREETCVSPATSSVRCPYCQTR